MSDLTMIPKDTEPKNFAGGEPVPVGKYKAQVVNSETKATAAGGLMLKLDFEILDGEFAGRHVFENFNIVNASEKAQQIARGVLAKLCVSCGLPGVPDDSLDLHERPVVIDVAIEKSKDPQYGDKNKIRGYYSTGDVVAPKPIAASVDDNIPF